MRREPPKSPKSRPRSPGTRSTTHLTPTSYWPRCRGAARDARARAPIARYLRCTACGKERTTSAWFARPPGAPGRAIPHAVLARVP